MAIPRGTIEEILHENEILPEEKTLHEIYMHEATILLLKLPYTYTLLNFANYEVTK